MSMDAREVKEWADRFYAAARGGIRNEAHKRLIALALYAEGQGKENATGRPRVRTGNLRRSIAGTVEGNPTDAEMSAVLSAGGRTEGGGEVPYAASQEYGATIRPRRAKWLTIPTDAVKTAAGVARGSARSFNARFVPVRSDLALLVDRDGKAGRGRVLFVLKRQVTIPSARFLGRAFDDMLPIAEKQLGGIGAEVLP